MEKAHKSEEQAETLLKCFRWGVCDEGSAEIAGVDISTVARFREQAAERAIEHHHQMAREIKEEAVQVDEAHTKVHSKGAYWVTPAIAMQSLFILFVVFGDRNQKMADVIIREIKLRLKGLKLLLSDGWHPYASAFLRYFGKRETPEKTKKAGRPKMSFWKAPVGLLYAQVVKRRDKKRKRVVEVVCRAVFGRAKTCLEYILSNHLGNTIHTVHIERWFGTMRSCVASCRRKTRCGSKSVTRHQNRVWLFVSLYNWVIPHSSLGEGGPTTTPAMAAGLIDHVMSYREYIWTPVHYDLRDHMAWEKKALELDEQANQKTKKFRFKELYERLLPRAA